MTTLWPDMSRVGLSWWTTLRWMAHGYRGRSSWRINCLSGSMGILTRRPSRLEKPLYLSQHRCVGKDGQPGNHGARCHVIFWGVPFLEGGSVGGNGKWEMGNLWEMAQGSDAFAVVERQSCPKMCAGRTGTTKHSPARPICSQCRAGHGPTASVFLFHPRRMSCLHLHLHPPSILCLLESDLLTPSSGIPTSLPPEPNPHSPRSSGIPFSS